MNNKVFFKPNSDGKTYKYVFVHFEEGNSFIALSKSYEDVLSLESLEDEDFSCSEAEKILIEIEKDIFPTDEKSEISKEPWKHCLNGGIPLSFDVIRRKYNEKDMKQ